MSLDDRQEIQECLNRGMTFKSIAARIGKDQTTVSKEVKKHLSVPPRPSSAQMLTARPRKTNRAPSS
ncbi:MAG: helix-turn-helix domain-containing protein, partial [Clostridiales bacterium]|jgi:IS30 family transposase|nr:helix-turn-helix domain-containing protein [Clostridiales bacterium]